MQTKQITDALRAALQNKTVDWAEAEYPASWNAFFDVAAEQKLLPMLLEAVSACAMPEADQLVFTARKRQVLRQVGMQNAKNQAFYRVYTKLRKAGLHPLVMKGRVCSALYPKEDYRISGDDDLLIPWQEADACHKILLSLGMQASCTDAQRRTAVEVSYFMQMPPVHIELHLQPFPGDPELNRFLPDVHKRAVEMDGVLTLDPQDHLLYLLLHAYKHFIHSGVGLRQVCDICLWMQKRQDSICWDTLLKQCQDAGIACFTASLVDMGHDCLQIPVSLPEDWDDYRVDYRPMLEDMLDGGIYGSNSDVRLHSATISRNAVRAGCSGKRQSLSRSLFPEYSYMRGRYPYLEKAPILLPAAWVLRIGTYFMTKNRPDKSLKLGQERLQLLRFYRIIR